MVIKNLILVLILMTIKLYNSNMKKEEIEQGNKIIAEFMEDTFHTNVLIGMELYEEAWFRKLTQSYYDSLGYNSSWDWLMPVVEKIESMGYVVLILENRCKIQDFKENTVYCYQQESTKILSVFKTCVSFIKRNNYSEKLGIGFSIVNIYSNEIIFTTKFEKEFIQKVNIIMKENEDDIEIRSLKKALDYLSRFCENLICIIS